MNNEHGGELVNSDSDEDEPAEEEAKEIELDADGQPIIREKEAVVAKSTKQATHGDQSESESEFEMSNDSDV